MKIICAFLLIFVSSASSLTVETRTDWPAGERVVKYNLGQEVPGGIKVSLNGQYLTLSGTEDLTFFPSFSWQTPVGKFSTSLSGRQLKEDSWRIWKGSWDYTQARGGLSVSGLRVFFPNGKEAEEWSCQYSRKNPWGNWGGQYFQRESFINQWSLPNRESLSWQRLRAQELYANGHVNLLKLGATQGYYWEWNRQEKLQEGERTMVWTEVSTSPWQLGPVGAVGKGRWQEAKYGVSSLKALFGEINISLKGNRLPLTAIYWQRKKVAGSTPFLFDREWDLGEVSLKSNLTGVLGGWELFSRYDYLGNQWKECWLAYKVKMGTFAGDNRFYLNPEAQKLVRTEANYAINFPGGSAKLQLDYNLTGRVWNNRGGQISFSYFTFRYQNRAGYSPQWSGVLKTSRFQLLGDWWENNQALKFTFRANAGNFEINCWPREKVQLVNRWDF